MKSNTWKRSLGILLALMMCLALVPAMALASPPDEAYLSAAEDNAVRLFADYGAGYEFLADLTFGKGVSEESVTVEKPLTALRVVKGDSYSLHLDRLTLGGAAPEGYERKLASTDNDLLEVADFTDFAISGSGELTIAARAPVELQGEAYSLKFPTENRGAIQSGSYFYDYTLGSHTGAMDEGDEVSVPDKGDLFASEMCYPDSGHPAAPIDFYVTDDGETLYVFFEAFVDNTLDHGKDFAAVHVKCGDTVKTYKVYTTEENEYGKWWFDYTDSSDAYDWEHMCYLVEVPMSEIETANGALDLAFEYYGTVSAYETLTRLGVGDKFFTTEDQLSGFPGADLLPAPGATVNANGGSTEVGEWWVTNTGTVDKPTYTLTLNGATITTTSTYYNDYYIFPYGSLTIKLAPGTVNTIGIQNSNDKKYGIFAGFSQDLIIEGAGTLNVYATRYSMYGTANLTVRDGATVNAASNTEFVVESYPGGGTSYTYSYDSVSFHNIIVDGATLTVDNTVSNVSKDDVVVYGITYWNSIRVQNNAVVEASASGGSSNAYGGNYAIRTYNLSGLTLDGDTVTFLEGESAESAEEVAKLTNLSEYDGDFLSKPYVKITQSITEPAPDAKMTITVSVKGTLATAKDGKTAMLNQPFTAKDIDKDGSITFDEALVAAHKAYNSASGYQVSDYGSYSAVSRVWGVDTMNTLFAVNHVGLSNGVLVDTVEAGDKLSVSVNKDDTYYADWYTYFVPEEVTAEAGEEVELTLMGHFGMAYMPEDLIDTPISDVQVGTWEKGTFTPIPGAVTDEDGNVTLTFDKAGTYIVSADGTVEDEVTIDWSTFDTATVDCPIIAPGCIVTVTATEYDETTVKAGEKMALPTLMVDGKDVTKEAKWESSDSSVATVYNGTVTGKKQGTAVITATYDGQTYTFPVTVTKGSSGSSGSASGSSSTSSKPKPKNTIILTIDNKTVMVNGNAVENDVAPFIEKDRTMLPIRFIAETLGAKVEWIEANRQVRIEKDKTVILLTIDSDKAYVNDMAQTLDSPAIIKSDRTFLPIRFVAENLGAAVDWNENARQVTITY